VKTPHDPHGPLDAPGWDAIDRALAEIYDDQTPHQFTSKTAYELDSPSPLPAITVWARPEPKAWHFVTYGLSELFAKTSSDTQQSGLGYELTLLLARAEQEDPHPPVWALRLLQGIGQHVLSTRADFDTGQILNLGEGMVPGVSSPLQGMICIPDPTLGKTSTPNGSLLFLRMIGLTAAEMDVLSPLDVGPMVAAIAELSPQGLTDPARSCWSQDPARSRILRRHKLGLRL